MKKLLLLILPLVLFSCDRSSVKMKLLQSRVDSLQVLVDHSYKPGLGEFMGSIQVHHDKLWFAGKNQNWPLAEFEVKEIGECVDDIKKYCGNRPETNSIGMINLPLQNILDAVHQEDTAAFISKYKIFTEVCNNCHQATKHGFNIITIPTAPPFSDQLFAPQGGK